MVQVLFLEGESCCGVLFVALRAPSRKQHCRLAVTFVVPMTAFPEDPCTMIIPQLRFKLAAPQLGDAAERATAQVELLALLKAQRMVALYSEVCAELSVPVDAEFVAAATATNAEALAKLVAVEADAELNHGAVEPVLLACGISLAGCCRRCRRRSLRAAASRGSVGALSAAGALP